MNSTKIIIADDHPVIFGGVKILLQDHPEFEIIDYAKDGKELLDIIIRNPPHIILLDINIPKLNGLEALRKINMQYKNVKVIILSTYDDEHLIQKALEYGAKGYLLKNNTEELVNCLNYVLKDQIYFPKKNAKTEVSVFDKQDSLIKQYQLTKRELEILQLIKVGCTNQKIAEKLFLSVYTVETHRKNIMQKLGLNSPAALMKFIIENNL